MRVVPGVLGVLLLSAMAIFGATAEASDPTVIAPDSLVFRDPFVSQYGVVLEVDVAAPRAVVFRDPFLGQDGTVLMEEVTPPTNIVNRDAFIAEDGSVTNHEISPPSRIVFREPFISEDGTVTNQHIDPPEGIVFRSPFVNQSGTVYASPVSEAPAAQLITVQGIYPNPFNPSTQVSFLLREPAEVEVLVLDLAGRRVCRMFQGPLPADLHVLQWNGVTDAGGLAASGQYLFRIQADEEVVRAKGLLIK